MGTPSFRRILCPTDFSGFSVRALNLAVGLAQQQGATVSVVHVVQLPVYFGDVVAFVPPPPSNRDELLEELRRFCEPARAAGVLCQQTILDGDPASEVLHLARGMPADLVVLGTHGRRGFDRWVLGSVTERVLRKADCPVLTVGGPADAPTHPELLFRRVLCAVDLWESARTLEYAFSIARGGQTRLKLLHVVEEASDVHLPPVVHLNVPEYSSALVADAAERLRKAVPEEMRRACDIEEIVLSGRVYRQILKVAKEEKADLIVMGAHGRNPLDLMFMGGTANHVVRQAECPVLMVRGTWRGRANVVV